MMKRFYTSVTIGTAETGWRILLDGKAVKTPLRAELIVPTHALAQAIANEWDQQKEIISPKEMVFCGYANAALDCVGRARDAVIEELARYLETDLLCYEAGDQPDLLVQQQKVWSAYRSFFAEQFGLSLQVTSGVMPVSQDPLAIDRLCRYAKTLDDFALTVFKEATNLSGSAVLGLALMADFKDILSLWQACDLDRAYQASLWGQDREAEQSADIKYRHLALLYDFKHLVSLTPASFRQGVKRADLEV